MSQNGVTTAADYKALLEAQRVRLPSGKVFLLCRPTLGFRFRNPGVFQSIALSAAFPGPAENDDEQVRSLVRMYYQLLCEVCVQPRVSLAPQEGELHPEQILFADAMHIARWAGGEVDGLGADLAEFRQPQSRPRPDAGASGGDVALPAERTPEPGRPAGSLRWGNGDPV